MSAFADAHEGALNRVRDNHGYDAGWTSACACGWDSNELRESEGKAIRDHWDHLVAEATPIEETA